MKTKILTAIAMLLTIVSVAGCASSKPMPDDAQLQVPASTAEQSLPQELRESVDGSKAADSHTEAKPEETAEKEMMISTLPAESVPTQPTEIPSQPTEPAKPTVPEPEPAAPPQPTEHPKPAEPAPTAPIPTEPQPTEPAGCTHDWQCIHHDEEGHWLAGVICDCGWTVYGSPDEISAAWNAHSASSHRRNPCSSMAASAV